MNAPAVLYALRWLIHDTFRQTLSSRVFWILLGLSSLCIVFCLGISDEGGAIRDEGELYSPQGEHIHMARMAPGKVSLLFGIFEYPFWRTAAAEMSFLLTVFASWVGGVIGLSVALTFTAGFIPESLQPSAASVMLAKPAPRWLFLLGKYLGVVCFVALQVAIFFLGTWLALGIKTGHWPATYLTSIPIMIFHFALIFSFSVMLAVLFRSPTASVVGTLLFWILCWMINYGRHFAVVFPELHNGSKLPELTVLLSEAGYWLLPKPADLTLLVQQSLNLGQYMNSTLAGMAPFEQVLRKDLFHPMLAIFTSCLFPVFALWASATQLAKMDY
jgi:ABC-type transport system involved in multi-copper enzyme maturation permease subunit